jgi:hypothetical protein
MATKSTSARAWRFATSGDATTARATLNTALGYPLACDPPHQATTVPHSCHILGTATDIGEIDGVARPAGATRVNSGGTSQPDRYIDTADQTPLWLIVLDGQSNAQGNSGTLDGVVDVSTALQWKQGDTGLYSTQFATANEPLSHPTPRPNEIGWCVAFCRALIVGGLVPAGHRPCVVPNAVGATGLACDGNRWSVGGDLHEQSVSRTLAAKASYPSSVVGVYLWHQGERDGVHDVSAATYRAALQARVADLRSRCGDAPFVCGGLAPDYTSSDAGVLLIHNELANVAANISNSAFAASTSLTTIDGVHFDAASYRTLGARYYTALEAFL